ncbi:MAG: hypothetical protein HY674_15235 [Chloroflexi bacterium]|nr:hypothetical protein [Chloroflexota bacterium]
MMNRRDRWSLTAPVRLCFFSIVLLTMGLATAQAAKFPLRWHWSNPTPHGGNIRAMAYTNGLYVQVCERGQIYTSDDLELWLAQDSHTTNALRAVTFFGDRIIITGENGTVVYGDAVTDLQFLSLGTSDWLEGVAASPDLLVAVGDNGAIYTSSDGAAWIRRPQSFTTWLRSVAYGAGFFVAVGQQGFVAVSQNGTSWQVQTSFTTEDLNKVAYINGQFWVVGNSGQTFARDLLPGWQRVNSGATNHLYAVAGIDERRLLAGDSEVRFRESRTWSNELDPNKTFAAPNWTYLSALWDGNRFLLGGRTGMLVEGFKTNGTSSVVWQTLDDSIRNWLWDVVRMPDFYIAVGDFGTVMTSDNGLNWDLEVVPDSVTNSVLQGVGGTTNTLLAVGSYGSILVSRHTLVTNVVTNAVTSALSTNVGSTLGVEWTAVQPPPTDNDLQGVAVWGNLFVITGGAGTILTSTDTTKWTVRSVSSAFLSGVTTFPGGLVAVGDLGAILTSPDGVQWTSRNSGTANWLYRVHYLGERLIAVGENGSIITSRDGMAWSPQASGTTLWLNDAAYIDDTYFVVGAEGTVLASTNALNWTNLGTISQKTLYGTAVHNGQLVAVGIEGIILRSQVAPISEPVKILGFSRESNQNLFLFSGQADQRFTLDRSTDLLSWVPGNELEILDSSGTLLYLEGSNSVPREFFRTTLAP